MRTAYLLSTYPAISQSFVMGEIQGLRSLGSDIETWTLRASGPSMLLSAADRAEADSTQALLPARWRPVAAANCRALVRYPRAYLSTLVRAVRDRSPGARSLAKQLGALALAVRLWRDLERSRTRHVHTHFAGMQTHIASLVAAFGNLTSSDDPPWTWSLTVHGPVEFQDIELMRLPRRARQALFVVVIGDYARSQLLARLPYELWDKVRVIHCGVDMARFEPPSRATDRPVEILYVGRLVPLKGQPILLDAFAELLRRGVSARLTLVGEGEGRAALEAHANRLRLGSAVTFAGAVGQDDILDRYRKADIFCLPSFCEGVPVVLMEAMAMCLPVITTTIAGIPELVDEGVSGILVRPGRTDQLVDAIEALARDPERRERLGRAGREKVKREYDIGESARRLAALHLEFRGGG